MRSASRGSGGPDAQTLGETLAALEYAENYMRWILELADPYLDGPILELGAGRGAFTRLLADRAPVWAVEPSDSLGSTLDDTYRSRADITVVRGALDDVPEGAAFGSAVLFNVLEHIADDGDVLDGIFRRLVPGGTLVLWVPAFPLLYSRFDVLLGHHRRYRLRPLIQLLEERSYDVVDARHVNALGWPMWLLGARLLGRVSVSSRSIAVVDRVAVPPMRAIERRVTAPFGQSIFVAASRPLDP